LGFQGGSGAGERRGPQRMRADMLHPDQQERVLVGDAGAIGRQQHADARHRARHLPDRPAAPPTPRASALSLRCVARRGRRRRAGAPARHNLHVLPEDVPAHKHRGAERAAQRSLSGPREQHPGARGRGTRLYVGIASNSSGRASHTTVSTGSSIAYTSPATGPQLSRDPRTNLQRRRGARGSGQDPRGGRGGTRARTRARQRRSARGRDAACPISTR
jgi:hypothetical protein